MANQWFSWVETKGQTTRLDGRLISQVVRPLGVMFAMNCNDPAQLGSYGVAVLLPGSSSRV